MSAPVSETPAAEVAPTAEAADREVHADVVVVGAGPSGSSAAYWLADRRPGRRAAREDHVPAREGLRRRAHPPRHPRPGRHGHRRQRGQRLAAQPRPAGHRRRPAPAAGLAGAHQLPALRPGPPARRPRRDARQRRPSRPAPGLHEQHQRHRADPRQQPAASSASSATHRSPTRSRSSFRAPIVLACEGVSGKLAQHLGVHRNDKRPLGVAVRRYYTSPRTHDDYLESWLELWDGPPNESRRCCPATAGSSAWATGRSTPASAS